MLWVHKYRPKRLEDVVLEPEVRVKLEEYIKAGEIPHLLFHGSPGTGKSTVAQILIDNLDCVCMKLNASLDRGIGVVRDQLSMFAASQGAEKWRIVFFDEADNMSVDALKACRSLIEQFEHRVRFIMTANYPKRIEPAILSRMQSFEFKPMGNKESLRRLCSILDQEGVTYAKDTVFQIIEKTYPDIRTAIQCLELGVVGGRLVEVVEADECSAVMCAVKNKNMQVLREIAYRIDYVRAMRCMFDNIAEIEDKSMKRIEKQVKIAEYLYRDSSIADRQVNFLACCLEVMA